MDNFELHERVTELVDTHTPYQLAKMLLKSNMEIEKLQITLHTASRKPRTVISRQQMQEHIDEMEEHHE